MLALLRERAAPPRRAFGQAARERL
jgi:hypothetical protein